MVAQNIVLQRPDLVRKLMLIGTGQRNGDGMTNLTPEEQGIFGKSFNPPEHLWLEVLFSPTATSQAAGLEFLKRTASRTENRDQDNNDKVVPAQIEPTQEWGRPLGERFEYLETIKPSPITTDQLGSYPKAIRRLQREGRLSAEREHRTCKYLNNIIKANHGALRASFVSPEAFRQ